jgi:hypothetical protein
VHYQHGNLHINLDAGWKQSRDQYNNVLYYKGYLDSGPIENVLDELSSQEEPKHAGNFCIIKCFNQGITVKTDRYRSFPLWYGESSLNNLVPAAHNIWTDGFAMITDSGQLIESKFQLIDTFEAVELEFDEVVNRVDTILTTEVKNTS